MLNLVMAFRKSEQANDISFAQQMGWYSETLRKLWTNECRIIISCEKQRRVYNNFLEDLGILKDYFEDKSITDIKVISTGEIIIEKFAIGKEFTNKFLTPQQVKWIILSASSMLDLPIDYSTGLPKLEATLPKPYNLRFTGILPPAVENAEITMRRPANRIFTLEEYLQNNQMTKEQYKIICDFIEQRKYFNWW